MSHYRATSPIGDVIEYDAELPQPEHLTEGWRLENVIELEPSPDDPPPGPTGPRRLTKLEFIEQLGDTAFATILTLAKQSIDIEVFVERFKLTTPEADGTSVDLDDPRTIAGVTAIGGVLQQMGVVDGAWAEGVLNGS